jgi:hypothetical protein
MPHVLHLLKSDPHTTALSVIERQSREPDTRITVVLLHGGGAPALPDGVRVRRLAEKGSHGDLTHSELLDLIFAADSVVSW